MTLFRVGSLIVGNRRELCLIKNISAGGMMVRIYNPIADDTPVQIELKTGQPISGRVCWSQREQIGVSFDTPVDVIELLAGTAEGPRPRMPRIEVANYATLRQGARSWRVKCCDISQGGAKVECVELFETDADTVLSLPHLPPQACVVRWQANGFAGVSFNRPLSLNDLVVWLKSQRDSTEAAAQA